MLNSFMTNLLFIVLIIFSTLLPAVECQFAWQNVKVVDYNVADIFGDKEIMLVDRSSFLVSVDISEKQAIDYIFDIRKMIIARNNNDQSWFNTKKIEIISNFIKTKLFTYINKAAQKKLLNHFALLLNLAHNSWKLESDLKRAITYNDMALELFVDDFQVKRLKVSLLLKSKLYQQTIDLVYELLPRSTSRVVTSYLKRELMLAYFNEGSLANAREVAFEVLELDNRIGAVYMVLRKTSDL